MSTQLPAQLEFPLVSPYLAGTSLKQMERVRRKAHLAEPMNHEEAQQLAALTVRLSYLDMRHSEHGVSLGEELGEARVLLGEAEWKRSGKLWTRRAERDPRLFKKLILLARHELGLL